MIFDVSELDVSSSVDVTTTRYLFRRACYMVAKHLTPDEMDALEMRADLTLAMRAVSTSSTCTTTIEEVETCLEYFPNDPFTSFMN